MVKVCIHKNFSYFLIWFTIYRGYTTQYAAQNSFSIQRLNNLIHPLIIVQFKLIFFIFTQTYLIKISTKIIIFHTTVAVFFESKIQFFF